MLVETSILKEFSDSRESFDKFQRHLNLSLIKESLPTLHKLYTSLSRFYEKNLDSTSCSLPDLEATYLSLYPSLREPERKELSSLFKELSSLKESPSVIELLNTQLERAYAHQLGLVSFEVAQGIKDISSLKETIDSFDSLYKGVEDSSKFITSSLPTLLNSALRTKGLRWRMDWLNKAIGSLRKGDFTILFSRSEVGKTTFLASEATHMLDQTDRDILWFNNEQQGEVVMLRCYQAYFGLTVQELLRDQDVLNKEWEYRVGNRLKLYDDAGIRKQDVESILKQTKPALILFDQIDKITGFKREDRKDLELTQVYQWARELAKQYCPVIGVCQANSEAEGKKWLTKSMCANSRTGKAGEADLMIGIGVSNEDGLSSLRYINLCKNKLFGDEDTLPELRHGKFTCRLEGEIARYVEL